MEDLTLERAKLLTDEELLSILKQFWDIPENEAIGVVASLVAEQNPYSNKYYYRIYNVQTLNGKRLKYPLSDIDSKNTIASNGIFVPPLFSNKKAVKEGIVRIRCELTLASKFEREKHNNPLLLEVIPQTIQFLTNIDNREVIKGAEGNILVEESIVNHYIESNKKQLHNVIEDLEKQRIHAEKELEVSISAQQKILKKEMSEFDYKRLKLTNEIEELYQAHDKQVDKTSETKKLHEELLSHVQDKENELIVLNNAVEEIKKQMKDEKERQMKKVERLRSFIKLKADSLLSLEFIDEVQYHEILDITKDVDKSAEQFLDFDKDFESNLPQAVSYIQAYLYNKDIIYPKYILENFFALIQTNDLIILAGDSGSGKTNLVKSFADAVGGVSKIIPVKPSWTSSEDLLGYYNPLQKTYLSTPFLEALIEASQNPSIPYFICLDEMNLARVEYYFADFLSVLEERDIDPEIFLYSDEESNHVLNEFNNVIQAIEDLKLKYNKTDISGFYDILKDPQINSELKTILGLSDKVSLISYHSTLRRMLGGILNTPSSITYPSNVRIIGAINIDETTHYLSPKVLDRAHVIKFDNPLLTDWDAIEKEVEGSNIENSENRVRFNSNVFGERKAYPKFRKEDEFSSKVVALTREYLKPLGVEIGLRTIRQGLNYKEYFKYFNANEGIAFNNFILHKILPKFTFDGNTLVGNKEKIDIVEEFKTELKHIINQDIDQIDGRNSIEELNEMLQKSKENDHLINYWA